MSRTLWAAIAAIVVLGFIGALSFMPLNQGPPSGYGATRDEAVFRDCADCPEMLPLAPGTYDMGQEGGRRAYVLAALGLRPSARRHVTLDYAFAAARHEVTFDQWEACVADGGCGGHVPQDEGWGRGDRPVIHVSWEDAQAYVRWLSARTGQPYRLLTEAEWEYAARAGTTSRYPWGGEASHDWANYGTPDCPPCVGKVSGADRWLNTAPVGQFSPNRFGLHDTQGNVYEWVQDCMAMPMPVTPTDGGAYVSDDCENRVIRGGAWYSDLTRISSTYRAYSASDKRDRVIGFRVARNL